jgi:hypothetical protein
MHRDAMSENRFLTWVEESYGEPTKVQCAELLRQASSSFSPLEIVSRAQSILYRDEIEAAAVLGETTFASDIEDDDF